MSGLVRTQGGVGMRSALMWHQYLCPCLCFLSLGCHALPMVDNVFLDYVIGLGALRPPTTPPPPPFVAQICPSSSPIMHLIFV